MDDCGPFSIWEGCHWRAEGEFKGQRRVEMSFVWPSSLMLNWETKFLREIYRRHVFSKRIHAGGRISHETFERKDKQMFYGDKFLQNSAQASPTMHTRAFCAKFPLGKTRISQRHPFRLIPSSLVLSSLLFSLRSSLCSMRPPLPPLPPSSAVARAEG